MNTIITSTSTIVAEIEQRLSERKYPITEATSTIKIDHITGRIIASVKVTERFIVSNEKAGD